MTGVTSAAGGSNCTMPTSTVGYPTLGFGTSAGTATRIYNAAALTGAGPVTLTPTFAISVAANQKIGASSPDTFTSTWTAVLASGP